MNNQSQDKEEPKQPDQPEYKDQPLPDTKSKGEKMINKPLKFRLTWVLIIGLALLSFGTIARADGDRGEKRRHGHYQHRHHDGRWYAHDEVIVHRAPRIQVNL
jgi:hypothetical protein